MSENDIDTGEDEQTLSAKKENGVYLLAVEKEYDGYTVHSGKDITAVESVEINGNHIGTSGRFEVECDDYIIEDATLTLWFSESDYDV